MTITVEVSRISGEISVDLVGGVRGLQGEGTQNFTDFSVETSENSDDAGDWQVNIGAAKAAWQDVTAKRFGAVMCEDGDETVQIVNTNRAAFNNAFSEAAETTLSGLRSGLFVPGGPQDLDSKDPRNNTYSGFALDQVTAPNGFQLIGTRSSRIYLPDGEADSIFKAGYAGTPLSDFVLKDIFFDGKSENGNTLASDTPLVYINAARGTIEGVTVHSSGGTGARITYDNDAVNPDLGLAFTPGGVSLSALRLRIIKSMKDGLDFRGVSDTVFIDSIFSTSSQYGWENDDRTPSGAGLNYYAGTYSNIKLASSAKFIVCHSQTDTYGYTPLGLLNSSRRPLYGINQTSGSLIWIGGHAEGSITQFRLAGSDSQIMGVRLYAHATGPAILILTNNHDLDLSIFGPHATVVGEAGLTFPQSVYAIQLGTGAQNLANINIRGTVADCTANVYDNQTATLTEFRSSLTKSNSGTDSLTGVPGAINVSASDRVIGRVSSGAGAAEEIVFTDQAQALADDTSFGAMRTTMVVPGLADENVFTGTKQKYSAANPVIALRATGAAVDTKQWDFTTIGTSFALRIVNDAEDTAVNVITGSRSGMTASAVAITATAITLTGLVTTSGAIELGHATDTTLSRASAGVLAVEGHSVATIDQAQTISAAWTISATPQIVSIELGHASDTTLTRVSAGVVAIEGSNVLLASGLGSITMAYDADLAAYAANSTDGFWAHTGAGTGSARTLTAPAAGLSISNPAGIAGNPTFALANDLAALEGLGSTGFAARTTTDTWAQRSVAVGAGGGISISNGDGASGNPTISAAANLAALEGLSLIADRLPYANGTGTLALATLTAAGRALIDDADAAAQLVTLGAQPKAGGTRVGTTVITTDAGHAFGASSPGCTYFNGAVTGTKVVSHADSGATEGDTHVVMCGPSFSGTLSLRNNAGTQQKSLTAANTGSIMKWVGATWIHWQDLARS